MLQTIHDTLLQAPTALADAAIEAPAQARALDWVGMRGVAMPVQVGAADGSTMQVAASVDVAVDLLDPGARGVHMSRLYLQLQDLAEMRPLTAVGLQRLLQLLIDSQRGLSYRARLTLCHPVLLRRPALTSDRSIIPAPVLPRPPCPGRPMPNVSDSTSMAWKQSKPRGHKVSWLRARRWRRPRMPSAAAPMFACC